MKSILVTADVTLGPVANVNGAPVGCAVVSLADLGVGASAKGGVDTARTDTVEMLVDRSDGEARREVVKELVLDNIDHLLFGSMLESFMPPPNQLLAVVEGDSVVGCTAGCEEWLSYTADASKFVDVDWVYSITLSYDSTVGRIRLYILS
jgi:hypothetical protein